MISLRTAVAVLVLALAAGGPCGTSPVPSSPAASSSLVAFRESTSGFSTTDLRDAQGHIIQFNTANELIWTADSTHPLWRGY